MIGNIETGGNFGGLFQYLLASDKNARIIGGNVAGVSPLELTQEFNYCADQRRSTTKPVKHLILSFAPSDGHVSDEVKIRIAEKAVAGLGYTDNQYVIIDHDRNDPGHDWKHDNDHIHIAVNMITIDGERISDFQDKKRFEAIIREQEKEENLTQVVPSSERKHKALNRNQIQKYKRQHYEFSSGTALSPPRHSTY